MKGRPLSLTLASQTDATSQQQMADMLERLRRILELPGLEDFTTEKTLSHEFFDLFDEALSFYESYCEHVIQAEGWKVTCAKGCSHCCLDLVRGVHPMEIVNIYRAVRQWPDVEQVFYKARDNAEAFTQMLCSKLKPGETDIRGEDRRIVEAHRQYNRLGRPCMFLDTEKGCCRVYPQRPIVCRFFFCMSPSEWCNPRQENYHQRFARGIDPYRDVTACMTAISQRLGFKTLNYLSGAFGHFASQIMRSKRIKVTPSSD